MTTKLDLGYRNGGLGKRLSNLFAYPFVLDGVKCGSIEGFLQSLKQEGLEEQAMVAELAGYTAYKVGQVGNNWKVLQVLWWCGVAYDRTSRKYHDLLERAYDACFDANAEFREALLETGADAMTHVMGHHDPKDTTLTEWEYIYNMYRLRARAQQLALGDA
jgi:predicted NAD-dependent protein-ADP-ribosyltransferase YbiA (DUF1768 family)